MSKKRDAFIPSTHPPKHFLRPPNNLSHSLSDFSHAKIPPPHAGIAPPHAQKAPTHWLKTAPKTSPRPAWDAAGEKPCWTKDFKSGREGRIVKHQATAHPRLHRGADGGKKDAGNLAHRAALDNIFYTELSESSTNCFHNVFVRFVKKKVQ